MWRLLPPRLRREALFTATEWLAPRPSRTAPDPALPITVAGYFRAPSGLGEGARRLARALEVAGARVHRADLTGALRQGPPGPVLLPAEGPGLLVLHVNGPMVPWALLALGRRAIAGKRVVAFWNWELPALPQDWRRGYRFVEAIMAASCFAASAMRRPDGPPVAVVPYPVPAPDPAVLARTAIGVPEDALLFLSVFDAASSVERKNPLGAIRAHRAAFGDDPRYILLLKTYNTGIAGRASEEVRQAASCCGNVRILDLEMQRAEIWGLMRLCDGFVSLHRAEGSGLALAEAMQLGRPVVATGWSGNMDFMDDGSALLVPHRLVPAADQRGTYTVTGGLWAEPDIEGAAMQLRRLAEAPALRTRIAEAARRRVAELSFEACGRRALAVLNDAGSAAA